MGTCECGHEYDEHDDNGGACEALMVFDGDLVVEGPCFCVAYEEAEGGNQAS